MTGSFVRIIHTCKNCSKDRIWASQPYVKNTPLGNLLISAAILYTGSLPAKSLQFLKTPAIISLQCVRLVLLILIFGVGYTGYVSTEWNNWRVRVHILFVVLNQTKKR